MSSSVTLQQRLPLPTPVRKASFANLARFFGLGSGLTDAEIEKQHDSAEEDAEEGGVAEENENDVDEETLMWDAQVGASLSTEDFLIGVNTSLMTGRTHRSSTIPCHTTVYDRSPSSLSLRCGMPRPWKPIDPRNGFHRCTRYPSTTHPTFSQGQREGDRGGRGTHKPTVIAFDITTPIFTILTHVLRCSTVTT